MKLIIALFLLGGLITLACYLWPQINFRDMPTGLCKGELNVTKPNWVSSTVDTKDDHYIRPLKIDSLLMVAKIVKRSQPQVTIVKENQNRILAYRQSTIFHFTDWICIEANGSVTASATLGYSDLNQNRKWVESIRLNLQQ